MYANASELLGSHMAMGIWVRQSQKLIVTARRLVLVFLGLIPRVRSGLVRVPQLGPLQSILEKVIEILVPAFVSNFYAFVTSCLEFFSKR